MSASSTVGTSSRWTRAATPARQAEAPGERPRPLRSGWRATRCSRVNGCCASASEPVQRGPRSMGHLEREGSFHEAPYCRSGRCRPRAAPRCGVRAVVRARAPTSPPSLGPSPPPWPWVRASLRPRAPPPSWLRPSRPLRPWPPPSPSRVLKAEHRYRDAGLRPNRRRAGILKLASPSSGRGRRPAPAASSRPVRRAPRWGWGTPSSR